MISTCLHCPLKVVNGQRCDIFERATKAIRGSGVTAAKIRCDKRKSLFQPGQYVVFTGAVRGREPGDAYLESFYGWIWKFDAARDKWLICGEDTDSPFVRIRPDRVTVLSGDEKRCCLKCGKPEGVSDKWTDRKTGEAKHYVCGGHYEDRPLGVEWVEDACEFPEVPLCQP